MNNTQENASKPNKRRLILAAIAILAVIGGTYVIYQHMTYVTTDNAQVNAHYTLLSSRVAGTIQKVLVEENQKVKAGDTLAQIDTSDYSNATEAAEAQVASLQARTREAETNYHRATELFSRQAVSKSSLDTALATFKELQGRLKAASAQLDQAKLNASYTRIVAPANGTIARKSVEPGQYIGAGQPLFGFVFATERWVTANLKETELEHVKIGNPVDVEVDAIPGQTFKGKVESFSPSTGATFSLLPPDNATGNFTKVVQHVPVRIHLLDLKEADVDRLAAGLSADIAIRIR